MWNLIWISKNEQIIYVYYFCLKNILYTTNIYNHKREASKLILQVTFNLIKDIPYLFALIASNVNTRPTANYTSDQNEI